MAIYASRFQQPSQVVPQKATGTTAAIPIGGINAAQATKRGVQQEAYYLNNITVEDYGYRRRSGCQSLYTVATTSSDASRIEYMVQARSFLVFISGSELYYTNEAESPTASIYSSIEGIPLPLVDYNDSLMRYDSCVIDHPTYGQSLVLTCIDQMVPQVLPLAASSSYTTHQGFIDSSESYAYATTAIDDRLVVFGTIDTSGVTHPTRVRWTQRGSGNSFIGGGFEDLVDMSGTARAITHAQGRMVLFTEREVWQATPRRDAYAFDFLQLKRDYGLIAPRAYVDTPYGLFWVANDRSVKRLVGNRISTVSKKIINFFKVDQATSGYYASTSNDYLQVEAAETAYLYDTDGSDYLTVDSLNALYASMGLDNYLTIVSEAEYLQNIFLTYNPIEREVLVWYGTTATAIDNGSEIALSLRVDSLQATSDYEDDGIWTTYTLATKVNAATAYVDSTQLPHMLYGPSSTNTWPEVCEWDSSYTYDLMGQQSSDFTGDWYTNTIYDREAPFLAMQEVVVYGQEKNESEGVLAVQVSAATSPKQLGEAYQTSTRTLAFGASSSAESTYAYMPFSTKASPWTRLHVKLLADSCLGEVIITRMDMRYKRHKSIRRGYK